MERDPRIWIAVLRNSHERLASLVSPLTPEQLRGPAYPTEWSIAQVLSHLGSGAEIADEADLERLRKMFRASDPHRQP